MIEAAYAARLEADARAADTRTEIAGGTRLSTPALPDIWDLNVAMLAPWATDADVAAAAELDVRRITLFRDYDGPVPAGFATVERCLLMTYEGEPPPPPAETAEIAYPQHEGEEAYADQIAELHRRQAAAGARTYGIDGVAWAVVANGCIDDVWVVEDRRGEGLGRVVTTAALAAGGWFLWCLEDDPRPQTLYRSLGLREAGRVVQLTRSG